jgi:alpha-mannosidase
MVINEKGEKIPAQRLASGELVFVAENVPALGKSRFVIAKGKALAQTNATASTTVIENNLYKIVIDAATGTIASLEKKTVNRKLVDSVGFNQYLYLPGDSLEKMVTAQHAKVVVKENGPVLTSLQITADAPGANKLVTEVRLVNGVDRVEIINTIDKIAIRKKESVHFAFPFTVERPQVRYNIPWGTVEAEADQLMHSNRNWYTMQRWADVSNAEYGVTWSSPDAPLFQVGNITTGDLLGGLQHSSLWLKQNPPAAHLYSWVMNNLWHTNFRAEQDSITTFHYYLNVHEAFNQYKANQAGLNNHRPLVVAAADNQLAPGSLFTLAGEAVYAEAIKPASDGNGYILYLVNSSAITEKVIIKTRMKMPVIHETNLLEEKGKLLENGFAIPGKGMLMIRVQL